MLTLSQLKARVDLVSVAGRYTELHWNGTRWQGLCPLHDDHNPSFIVDADRTRFHCFGCGRGGSVLDFLMAAEKLDLREAAARLTRETALATPRSALARDPDAWRARLAELQPLEGTPGEAYLRGRGIHPFTPTAYGVRYHPCWHGRGPAVVYPFGDAAGETVALEGRFLDAGARVKGMCAGPKRAGVFYAPLLSDYPGVLIITEGAVNALSVALCGFPALATGGAANLPAWLPARCRRKRVYIGFDPDAAGQAGARRLAAALGAAGVPATWLHPPLEGVDFNDYLQYYGQPALTRTLAAAIPGWL